MPVTAKSIKRVTPVNQRGISCFKVYTNRAGFGVIHRVGSCVQQPMRYSLMMSRFVSGAAVAVIMLAGVLAAPATLASHIDWDARRAEREAERETRRAEREAERARKEEPQCVCSADVSYVRPELKFSTSGLVFTPRINVDIRLRGDTNGPKHTVGVRYSGQTDYASDHVSVPEGVSFSGEKTLVSNASCEGRWSFDGMELARLPLPGLTRSVVGEGQRLTGTARVTAAVTGCTEASEDRQFSFTLRDLGRLSVGSWRSPR